MHVFESKAMGWDEAAVCQTSQHASFYSISSLAYIPFGKYSHLPPAEAPALPVRDGRTNGQSLFTCRQVAVLLSLLASTLHRCRLSIAGNRRRRL
ncbi:hypothetical protein RJ55_05708 [Drechmeria coniospora]|nr:hypothetical protein RJ55_05708 [Drechmeria coniospora]